MPTGWARLSTVIQSPASRAARRRSCQARSGSSGRSRSSRPNANQRSSSSGSWNRRSAMYERAGGALAPGRVPEARARRRRGAASERRTAAPIPGAIRAGPRGTPGRRARGSRAASASAKASGSSTRSARLLPSARRSGCRRRRRRPRAPSPVTRRPWLRRRPRPSPSSVPGSGSVRHVARRPRAETVARLELALAGLVGRDVGTRGRGRTSPSLVDDRGRGLDDRRRLRDDPPSARTGWPTGTGRRYSIVIRAVTPQLSSATSDQAMTSSRTVADDPAVGDIFPALEPGVERQLRPRPAFADVEPIRSPSALSSPQAKQLCGSNSKRATCSSCRPDPASRRRQTSRVLDLARLGLDEVLARGDLLAHQHREDLVGLARRPRCRPAGACASPGSSSCPRAGRRSSRRGP